MHPESGLDPCRTRGAWHSCGVMERPGRAPRAVGRRISYGEVPAQLRAWVAERFGPVEVLTGHLGGMSPGCATSLLTADGRVLFVKAVGVELQERTVELFRQEAQLLARLPAAVYRPTLRAVFDEGGWVALVFDHVPGGYPDLDSEADFAAVARVVTEQVAELTPPPPGVKVAPLAVTAGRWAERWDAMRGDPGRFLPGWAVARFDELAQRVRALPGGLPAATLCHCDLRDDNLLIDGEGRVVVLDWGMARLGPGWTDLVLLAAQQPTPERAQESLRRWVPPQAEQTATSLLAAFGGSEAWKAQLPMDPSLPTMAAFCRENAERMLAIAQLRLDG